MAETHMNKSQTGKTLDAEDDRKSLFIFRKNNPIRAVSSRFVHWRHFDNIVLLLIIISSILLAMDNPLNDPEGDLSITLG